MNENETSNAWEHEMTNAFDRRVRDLHEAPLSFDRVRGTATKIRRRRRAAVAGGVLAVAAVIAPVAVVAGNSLGNDTGTIAPATQTPAPTVAPDVDPSPVGVPFLSASTLTLPDGTTFRMPAADYTVAAVLGDQVVGYRNENGDGTVDVIDQTGIVQSFQTTSAMVVSASGETVAFMTDAEELITIWDGGQRSLGTSFGEYSSAAAITGGPSCDTDECRVYVNPGDFETAPIVVEGDGTRTTVVPDTLKVQDVIETSEGDLVSLQVSYSGTGSCSAVFAADTQEQIFDTCDYYIQAISPDAEHLLVSSSYGDGLGLSFFAVIDLQGAEVARYAPEGGFISQLAWEDAGAVVATVYDGAGWRIVRQPLVGGLSDAVGPIQGSEGAAEVYLP